MAIKKSELYASLWKSCDELRGSMDASQYKDYVLVLLFMKYVSDKAASNPDYDLGVPPGASFADMVAAKGKPDIGERMNKIVAALADANTELKGAMNVADFDDSDKLGKGRDKVDKLNNLIGIFERPELDFRKNRADGDDLLGDAYEYLMRHFATQSGKSKGEFYTPGEVSRVLTQVVGVAKATRADQTIYDPTCGSGSLLVKAHDEAKNATGLDLAIYGQEMDNATASLAKMNMVLHDAASAEIWQDNTLSSPHFKDKSGGLKTFDFVVANPPFSIATWRNGFNPAADDFARFPYGLPPATKGDYAFLLHILASLKSTGKAAVVLPHGPLFRGNAEASIRRELVRRGFIKGIIGLPVNLFYGTSISACVIVLDKEGAGSRKGVFMIDASRGFMKDGNKNRLRDQDIHKIVDTFSREVDIPGFAKFVPLAEIQEHDFNLNLPRYVDSSDPEDFQDVDAHLRGGIPDSDLAALSKYWEAFPSVKDSLLESAGRAGYSDLRVPAADVKSVVFSHPEFVSYSASIDGLFGEWRTAARAQLRSLANGSRPKDLIRDLSESLLARFARAGLVDGYDVYQRLMDLWSTVIQDDVYLIADSGWERAAAPRLLVAKSGDKVKETADFVVGKQRFKSDLVPSHLLVSRYFPEARDAIDALRASEIAVEQSLEQSVDEYAVEGGPLEDLIDDKRKVSKRAVTARLRDIERDADSGEEVALLRECESGLEHQTQIKELLKSAKDALDVKLAERYGRLTREDILTLVVDDKWLDQLWRDVQLELGRVSQTLTSRLIVLSSRYETPMPVMVDETSALTARVDQHLKRMGFDGHD